MVDPAVGVLGTLELGGDLFPEIVGMCPSSVVAAHLR
jgi:hypothetical protein